ncbi:MAG TPA: hypothetical protein VJ779_06830 [Acetobacteraceae bacterium]|jgi:hypothetical protein|nr:hypothetical protein [Acetobacteraceae bacterium]
MPASDHWIYQGRQEHGWFGTGTAPPNDPAPGPADKDADNLFAVANAGKRIDAQ